MQPAECPNFNSCRAAICPLDPAWQSAVHLGGEKVCTYVLASGKPGAEDHYRDSPAFRVALPVVPQICARHPDIRRQVDRASRTPLRIGVSRRKPV